MEFYHYEGKKVLDNGDDTVRSELVDDIIKANSVQDAINLLLQENIIVTNIDAVTKTQETSLRRLKRYKALVASKQQPPDTLLSTMQQPSLSAYKAYDKPQKTSKMYIVFIMIIAALIAASNLSP